MDIMSKCDGKTNQAVKHVKLCVVPSPFCGVRVATNWKCNAIQNTEMKLRLLPATFTGIC